MYVLYAHYFLLALGTFYGSVQCGSLVWAEELLKGGWAKYASFFEMKIYFTSYVRCGV